MPPSRKKIALVGKSQLLIGMRLHSLIFSAISETPFIAISYDPKIDSFAEICNQPVIGDVTATSWNDSALVEKVNWILQRTEEHQNYIKKKLQMCKEEAMQTAMGAIQMISSKVN